MVNFPTTFDDNATLFVAVNNLRTALSSSINDSVTTVPVLTTSGFPSTGYISILSGDDILDTEAISYTGATADSFTGATRGAGGTTAVEHTAGDDVDLTIVAAHHNELKDATIALEHFVGISGAENFLGVDDSGNVVVTGTLVVAGTLTGQGDFDFAADGAISGSLTVGKIPVSTVEALPRSLEDDLFFSTTASYVDTGVETEALPADLNLLLFRANVGEYIATKYGSHGLRCMFGGTEVGEVEGLNTAVQGDSHWNVTELNGFKMVAGDGAKTAKLQVDYSGSGATAAVGTQAIVAVPLEQMGLVDTTDFWYHNGIEGDTAVAGGWQDINSQAFALPEAGDYLVFGYCEGKHTGSALFGLQYSMDGSPLSELMYRNGNGSRYKSFPFCKLITTTDDTHTFAVEGIRFTGTAHYRRARIAVIKVSVFEQIIGESVGAGVYSTDTTSFTEITSLTQTYTPRIKEQALVLAYTNYRATTADTQTQAAWKLRDKIDGVDYVVDAGEHQEDKTNTRVGTMLFTLLDEGTTPKEWALYMREANETSQQVDFSGGSLVIWGLTLTTGQPLGHTTIQGAGITTPAVTATTVTSSGGAFSSYLTVSGSPVNIGAVAVSDPLNIGTVNVSTSLTVSGIPVATGTGGGGASDITDINSISSGSITITGKGGIDVITSGQTITISGTQFGDGFRGFFLTTSSGLGPGASGADNFNIPWDNTYIDTDSFFMEYPNDTLVQVPSGINRMQFHGQVTWDDGTDNAGTRVVSIRRIDPSVWIMGQEIDDANRYYGAALGTRLQNWSSPVIDVDVGDTFRINAFYQGASGTVGIKGDAASLTPTWFIGEVKDPVAIPSHIEATSGTFTTSLTISGSPVAIGTGFSGVRTFFTPTVSGDPNSLNTITIAGGLITSWTQVVP